MIVELGIHISGTPSIEHNMLHWDLLMVNDVGDLLEGRELSFNPGGVAPTSRAMQLLALNPSYEAGTKKKEKK